MSVVFGSGALTHDAPLIACADRRPRRACGGMPPKVVRQWKPSGARMEANEDVEQLREILKDIRGPGIDDSK